MRARSANELRWSLGTAAAAADGGDGCVTAFALAEKRFDADVEDSACVVAVVVAVERVDCR